jgi:hypothetical protein
MWDLRLVETVAPAIVGTLAALDQDICAGLVRNLAMRGSGEVLGDMLDLAKEALANGGEGHKMWQRCWSRRRSKMPFG